MQVKKAIYEVSRAAWSSEERKREILKAFGISFQFCSLTQLCLTLRPHELQHTRLPCTLPTPGASSISCPLSQWCHPTVSSSVIPFSSCLQSFLASGAFPVSQFFASGGEVLTFWSFSFSISPSNEHPGLISFRMDWWISLQSRDSQESSLTPQFKSINSLVLSFLYSPTLTSVHDYWKNDSFE